MLRRLALDRRSGVHHVTNQGAVTWFEFAQAVAVAAGHQPAVVRPISTAELDPPRPAPRPANSMLDNAVLRTAGIPLLRDYHEPLAELVAALTRRQLRATRRQPRCGQQRPAWPGNAVSVGKSGDGGNG